MRFREVFKNTHTVLPVIHAEDEAQVRRNAERASSAGADGIWLINHSFSYEWLIGIYQKLRSDNPSAWIGLNCLELTPYETMAEIDLDVSGIWSDQAYIQEWSGDSQVVASHFDKERQRRNWTGLYFGGVAMKGQRHVRDLEEAARISKNHMDVLCTSGQATGIETPVDKVRRLKAALGEFPLAIASGVTPGNVRQYLPYVDVFLVATGVSDSFTELNENLLRELVGIVREDQELLASLKPITT